MKLKLNKTMRTICSTVGLLLFSAVIYAQQPMSASANTTRTIATEGDSLIIDIETALSIAMNENLTIKVRFSFIAIERAVSISKIGRASCRERV